MVHKNSVISGESEKGKQYFGSERKEQYVRERKDKKNIRKSHFLCFFFSVLHSHDSLTLNDVDVS